jgi:hypothetical protein
MNKTLVSMLCAAALLSACGGGGGDDSTPATPPVTEQVPPSVNTSVTSFMGYLVALLASAADALEPVDVSAVIPATDDAAEPSPMN